MLIADPVPAIVEINPFGEMTCPTISGNVYVSEGNKVLVLTIKLLFPADPATGTKLTESVAADAE